MKVPVFLALLVAGALLSGIAGAADSAPARALEQQKQTIVDIRNAGTAMFSWWQEEMAPKRSASAHKAAEDREGAPSKSIAEIPVISHADLAKILVPKYLASLPEKDPWGHSYEYHLNTSDPNAAGIMGVRSAGSDGRFSGDAYEVGPFPVTDFAQDVAWIDGYFIRWPQNRG
jgi:hypothetical protein